MLAGFRDIAGMANDPAVSQPDFVSQKITTTTSLELGEIHFLGTFSPPPIPAAGPGDESPRVCLTFIRVQRPPLWAERKELKPLELPSYRDGVDLEFSFYSLDRMAARDLIAKTSSVESPWKSVQELLPKNRAKFEHIVSLQTLTAQRAAVNENGEVRFGAVYCPVGSRPKLPEARPADSNEEKDRKGPPTALNSGAAAKSGAFTAFEMQETGVTVEVEPTLGPDPAYLDLNLVIQYTRDLGNLQATGVARLYPAQPVFEKRRIASGLVTIPGKHLLIGTLNPPGADGVNGRADDGRVWLAFVRFLGAK